MGINYDEKDPWPEIDTDEPELESGPAEEMMVGNAMVSAQAKHEIQSAIIVAKRYERNEDKIYQKFVHGSCKRLGFALVAEYEFKRGRKKDDAGKWIDNIVKGATIKFMRELVRLWGNVRYGAIPVGDTENKRQILAYAWDLETNTWIQHGDIFEKLIEKKDGWVTPDERELRELSNRRASLGIRSTLERIVPPDFIEDGLMQCKETLKLAIKDENSAQFQDVKKRVIAGFSQINVPIEEIEAFVGHKLASCSPAELETLRGIWAAIKDGHTTWASYVKSDTGDLPTEIKRASAAPAATVDHMAEARKAQEKLERERPKTVPPAQTVATAPADSKVSQRSQEPAAASANSSTKPSPEGRKSGLFE